MTHELLDRIIDVGFTAALSATGWLVLRRVSKREAMENEIAENSADITWIYASLARFGVVPRPRPGIPGRTN